MKTILILAAAVALLCCGCESYSHTPKVFPDGFNLTDYHQMGQPASRDTIAGGFSWSLK